MRSREAFRGTTDDRDGPRLAAARGGRPPDRGRPGRRARRVERRPPCCSSVPSTATPGSTRSIQAAVNAAQPGDGILVAPGDYHENDDAHVTSASQLSTGDHGGVVVHTSNLTIRGMNRDTVIVDGTKAGAPGRVQLRPAVPELRPGRRRQGPGPQRHRRVEGGPREHREPHRVQLPRRCRRLGEPGLVERRRRVGEDRPHRATRAPT